MEEAAPGTLPPPKSAKDRLDSWKEIAAYLSRDVTTVQRWEKREGMPVCRHLHDRSGSVYAFRSKLDAWMRSRSLTVPEENGNTGSPSRLLAPTSATRLSRNRWEWLLALSAVALGLVITLSWVGKRRMPDGAGAKPAGSIESLAVLPLDNLSHDPEQEYFSDGMTDALITQLSKTGALRLTSRTSVMSYKGTHKGLPEIAKELNVDAVIEGSVMRAGDRVRIAVQLIETRNDRHLWAETYDRDLGDVLRLQSEVAEAVAQQIQMQLRLGQRARLRSASTVNPQAYEAYLKGRFYGFSGTRAALKRAQGYYEDAVRKDPRFALAYAGLADCFLDQGTFRQLPPRDAHRQASGAIQKALQLDQGLSEAHGSLGYLNWQFAWEWRAAEQELRYAVELNPSSVEAHETLVWFLAWSGRRAEALAEVEKIRQIDRAYPFIPLEEAGVYYHLRDYKSLVEAGEKSTAGYPNGWQSHYFLAVGYEGSGHPAQAIPEYRQAVELSENDTDATAGLAHAYSVIGSGDEAEKIVRQLETHSKTDYVSPYMLGVVYAGLGQKDRAFELLERAYQEKSSDIAYFIKADLRLDSLRSDPRFQDLLRRMNLPN
jgi:TolB-like protein/Tfp pilus assembly protein PilF